MNLNEVKFFMGSLFANFINGIIKSEFTVYSNTQNSIFFAILKDCSTKRKLSIFSLAPQGTYNDIYQDLVT